MVKENQFSSLLQWRNMASRRLCSSCNNTFSSSQSLWNHRKRCPLKRFDDSFKDSKQSSVSNLKITNLAVKDLKQKPENDDRKKQKMSSNSKPCQERERKERLSSMFTGKPRVKQQTITKIDDHVHIPPMTKSKQIQPQGKILTESDRHGNVIRNEKDIKDRQDRLHHKIKSFISPEVKSDVSNTSLQPILEGISPSVFAKSNNDSPGISSVATKLKKDLPKLPSTIEGLQNRICHLIDNFNTDRNKTALKPEMIAILCKLKEKGAITRQECYEICNIIKDVCNMERDCENESLDEMETEQELKGDTDEASDETDDEQGSNITEQDFYQLIDTTVEKLTQNLRRNLNILILGIDDKIREKVVDFFHGEELAQSVTHYLDTDTTSKKVKTLIDEIERIRQQVKNVLTQLRDTRDQDTVRTLENLKMRGVINEEQFKKMMIAQNDIFGYARAMSGTGLWLGFRK